MFEGSPKITHQVKSKKTSSFYSNIDTLISRKELEYEKTKENLDKICPFKPNINKEYKMNEYSTKIYSDRSLKSYMDQKNEKMKNIVRECSFSPTISALPEVY